MRAVALLALGLVCGASAPCAQERDCTIAEAQVDLTVCAEQDLMWADAVLNVMYAVARDRMAAIDADLPEAERGAEAALRDAQRAWIGYRDNACAAEGFVFSGGSAEPMVIHACRARITQARSEDLRLLADTN